jgi:uncharacterized protein
MRILAQATGLVLAGTLLTPLSTDMARAASLSATTATAAAPIGKPLVQRWNRQAFDAYEAGLTERAAGLYLKAARTGEISARYNLASMKIRKETTLISEKTAMRWVLQAAQSGLAAAQFSHGLVLDLGQGVRQDVAKAADWFDKAATQGHPEAAMAMATAYFLGRGRAQDYVKSAYWYQKAAEGGEVAAQYSLASMYLTGLGVSKDLEAALQWFTSAARQGDIVAKEQARLLNERLAKDRNS